jgi:uncharacterized membrane protein (DUF2068 family)
VNAEGSPAWIVCIGKEQLLRVIGDLAMDTTTQTNGARAITLPPIGRHPDLPAPMSESMARALAVVGILAIGVIHILDAVGTYQSTRWIFWAYMALIVAAVPVAMSLLQWPSSLGWAAAAGIALAPLAGYLWSRTIGLPGDAPDVGNWLCTLGMASLFVESWLLALCVTRFGVPRRF